MCDWLKKAINHIEGWRGFSLALYTTIIMSSHAFFVYEGGLFFFRWVFLYFVISLVTCPVLLRFLASISIKKEAVKNTKKWRIVIFLISFFVFFFQYISYYPGGGHQIR